MAKRVERYRIHSYLTHSRYLHVEDVLDAGKLRLFAGECERGDGVRATACCFLDVADARVIFSDLAWGRQVNYAECRGATVIGGRSTRRVLKVWTEGEKVSIHLENASNGTSAEGTVDVSLDGWDARRLAHAVLSYVSAWEVAAFQERTQGNG